MATSGQNQQITTLNIEANRLKTFDVWNVLFINKQTLALLGFYYYDDDDDDDVLLLHCEV